MNSRVSWSVEGIEPSVRARAEAAARRAGMSLGDWLNSTIGQVSSTGPGPAPGSPGAGGPPVEISVIHQRLDTIARQIEQMARPAGGDNHVVKHLNDAISRLDARLSQISPPAPTIQAAYDWPNPFDYVDPAVRTPAKPLSSLDAAVAEITARQAQLDRHIAANFAPPAPPRSAPAPDMAALNQQLHTLTHKIDALQRPDRLEPSINAFRADLAEIRHIITEAMPRRAIESIEHEVQSLSQRLTDSRYRGIDEQALNGIEAALGEIRQTLSSLTPAEQLAGFDDAIRNLGSRIDVIVRASDNPATVGQLKEAIAALRHIVANVASNEQLERLSQDVHSLAERINNLPRANDYSASFLALEKRISSLTDSLATRDRTQADGNDTGQLEVALQALSHRLDNLPVGNDNSATLTHLEQRVSYLLERLENTSDQSADIKRVEAGLQDVLRQLERQQSTIVALAATAPSSSQSPGMDPAIVDAIKRELADMRASQTEAERHSAEVLRQLERQQSSIATLASASPQAPAMDAAVVEAIKRELSDMRFSQSETDRHTQDSLEVVHSTLGHVVDRLAIIEGDLRQARANPPPVNPPSPPANGGPRFNPPAPPPAPVITPTPGPTTEPSARFDAAPREFVAPAMDEPVATSGARPLREILSPLASKPRADRRDAAASDGDSAAAVAPDTPLEPGTRPTGRPRSTAERIAASEQALNGVSPGDKPASTSSFIAAARRAAMAATDAAPYDPRAHAAVKVSPKSGGKFAGKAEAHAGATTISSKIRSLLVGASVVVIVLGSFQAALVLMDRNANLDPADMVSEFNRMENPDDHPQSTASSPAANGVARGPTNLAPPVLPTMPSEGLPGMPGASMSQLTMPGPGTIPSDITGSIPEQQPSLTPARPQTSLPKFPLVQIPANEQLPDSIGGPTLRSAALKGDATAAYEVALRFAEGKGVPQDFEKAARWFERASSVGVVPAQFRLGTLHEKGLVGKKDINLARELYAKAADRGNAKAMHNLAVLDADGGDRGPNYKSAAHWFRKAAERGVADSQFNLGILFARGIGVEQNLAESYKWFALAAAQGDADAGMKRDDVAKRLNPQSLDAAKAAVKTFIPVAQPDDAVNVATPAGGWEPPQEQTDTKPPAGKRAGR